MQFRLTQLASKDRHNDENSFQLTLVKRQASMEPVLQPLQAQDVIAALLVQFSIALADVAWMPLTIS